MNDRHKRNSLEIRRNQELDGMLQAFQDHLAVLKAQRYEANELLAHLAEMEYLPNAYNRTDDMLIKLIKFKYNAVFEEVECSAEHAISQGSNSIPSVM